MHKLEPSDRILNRAYWALAAICLWNLNGITAMAFGVTRLLSAAILFLGLIVLWKSREPWARSLSQPGVLFILTIVVYLGLGSLNHFEGALFVSHVASIILVLVGAVGARALAPRIGLPRFMMYTAVIASLGAFTVFLSPFLRPIYMQLKSTAMLINAGRWMGFFANPNETGMAAVYALAASLSTLALSSEESKLRKFMPYLLLLLGLGLLMTFSRGAMVGFAAVSGFYVFSSMRLSAQSIKLIIAGAILLAGSLYFFTSGYKHLSWTPEQHKRIRSIERIITGQRTTTFDVGSRTAGANAGLKYWQRKPLLGHGLGKLRKMNTVFMRGHGCHNTHVMFLGEVGMVGFVFYGLFWISMILRSHRHDYPIIRQFCLMLVLTMLLNGMVGHTLLDNRNANFMLGLALGLASLTYREPEPRFEVANPHLLERQPQLA